VWVVGWVGWVNPGVCRYLNWPVFPVTRSDDGTFFFFNLFPFMQKKRNQNRHGILAESKFSYFNALENCKTIKMSHKIK